MYVDRFYRENLGTEGQINFRTVVKETDLFISMGRKYFNEDIPPKVEKLVTSLRYDLEMYIKKDPEFKTALAPRICRPDAPLIAKVMTEAGNKAGVGPMAAVAGAFSEFVGKELLKTCNEFIVENGGDIFLASFKKKRIGIFAGTSPLSNKIAIEITPEKMPLGICTSSGTVGPSLSFGKADAVVVISKSAALADAVATAAGNVVETSEQVAIGVDVAKKIKGILGVVVVKDDKIAVWGDIKLVPCSIKKMLD